MLSFKLSRVGKKKQPQYRIVVTEKSKDPWGKVLEIVGHYNPRTTPKQFEIKKDRVDYWYSKGTRPSETLNNLFITHGVIKGEKINKISITKRRRDKMEKKK